ncbi:cbb3-type cytochrome c oxidase subunit I, partial [bacterium]|nr:cbb3-type cytochrome c oxidase subunit I [bacterium]
MSSVAATEETAAHGHHPHSEDRLALLKAVPFWSTDHKVIGIQFLLTTMFMMMVGGSLALGVRWQLAFPWENMPILGYLFSGAAGGGQISPEFYTMLFTMHATVMIFLVIIPVLAGAFGNFLIPLMIGADDMAFPLLNALSYWVMWPAIFCFGASFVFNEGLWNNGLAGSIAAGPASGWTSYPALSAISSAAPGSGTAQFWWLMGVTMVGVSSMMGSVNYMTTIINMRAPGMTLFRMPLTIWSMFITAILQAFALPVLTAAGFMLVADRTLGTCFFIPSGLIVNNAAPTVGG